MKEKKSKKTEHLSIFLENISAYPIYRYYDTINKENAQGQAQELFGLGNIPNQLTGKTELNGFTPAIILVDSITQEERYITQQDTEYSRRIEGPIKILRRVENLTLQFKFYEQNVKNQSISYHCLILKLPIGINIAQLFLTDEYNTVDTDNYILTGIQDKPCWDGYDKEFRWINAKQRTGPGKYLIGSLFLPYLDQYLQPEIKIKEEIELYPNERIICLLLSYDLSTQYTETIFPRDPYEGGSHPVDMGHYGYFSGHVSYDIYF